VEQDVWISPSQGVQRERDGAWTLKLPARHSSGRFDAVVIAHNGKCAERLTSKQPSHRVHALLRANFAAQLPKAPRAGSGRMSLNSLYSLLFEVKAGLLPSFAGAFVDGEPSLRWLSNNAMKYGQLGENTHVWTALSSASFGQKHKHPQEHLEGSPKEAEVTTLLLEAVERATGLGPGTLKRHIVRSKLQLWGAAVPINRWSYDYVWDASYSIGIAGDWLSADMRRASTIEGAWFSGTSLADHIALSSSQDYGLELGERGGRFEPAGGGGFGSTSSDAGAAWVALPSTNAPTAQEGRRKKDTERTEKGRDNSPPRQRQDGNAKPALFVVNLPYAATEADVAAHFETVAPGEVQAVRLLRTAQGKSRGLGSVQLRSANAAGICIQELDGSTLGGRVLKVSYDKH